MKILATPLSISPDKLPDAYVGTPYSQQLKAVGGTGSGYKFSVDPNNLPPSGELTDNGDGTATFVISSPVAPLDWIMPVTLVDSDGNTVTVNY